VPIDIKAAVLHAVGQPLVIETLQLDDPQVGEVLVEMKAAGLCQSDLHVMEGRNNSKVPMPVVLGHEGAGVVLAVGPGVTTLQPGDHVIPYQPECRQCAYCTSGKTNRCLASQPPNPSRMSLNGRPVANSYGLSTFATHSITPEIRLAKIRADAPFDEIACVGCAGATGIGSALFVAKVEAGSKVVVFGLGGIGLNIVQACRMAGAVQIVGVDTNPAKEELARRYGVTTFVNPKTLNEDLVTHLRGLTGGGADYAFEAIGSTATMEVAFEVAHPHWGQMIMVGEAPEGSQLGLAPANFIGGRSFRGAVMGGVKGRTDLPKLVDWIMQGKLNLSDMVTRRISLDQINEGYDDLRKGIGLRSVVIF
jgi:S-(hydroxymethyl)glutathione dehydrogenase/alcohol dehydrogenase